MTPFDQEFDVVVVGSGAGAMTAAWAAKRKNLSVVVIEKAAVYGGNTAMSGGAAWMPNAPVLKRHGHGDDPQGVYNYLRAIAPNVDPERHRRYVEEGPKIFEALEELPQFKNGYYVQPRYADYHMSLGGSARSRGVFPRPIALGILGEEANTLRKAEMVKPGIAGKIWFVSKDLEDLNRLRWGFNPWRQLKVYSRFGWRLIHRLVTGQEIVTMGRALIVRFRLALKDAGIPIWLNTPLKSLITENDAVVGVLAERNGQPVRIRARAGVVIAAGGFEYNKAMRAQYQPELPDGGCSMGASSNTGDGIQAGVAAGAAIDLMDYAWWMPALVIKGKPQALISARQAPRGFIVNSLGKRFINEACPYPMFGQIQIEAHRTGVSHLPAYLILDNYTWTHNFIAGHIPGQPIPPAWLEAGTIVSADSMPELAKKIGVPPENLVATTERFNTFARNARDEDFHRGENAYDNYYGDESLPNPNLAEVRNPPYVALRLTLSDLGTSGGLLTNADSQVLNRSGQPIPGLYAAGNSSATLMGYGYAGPGGTIGPAMVQGWLAASAMASLMKPATR